MHRYTEASETLPGRIAIRFHVQKTEGDRIEIDLDDGKKYVFLHNRDCCESVNIHDVQGDLANLVGSPLLVVTHESTGENWPADVPKEHNPESWTWTTLTFETAKGRVVVRWLGESNGYYGEGVDFEEVR